MNSRYLAWRGDDVLFWKCGNKPPDVAEMITRRKVFSPGG